MILEKIFLQNIIIRLQNVVTRKLLLTTKPGSIGKDLQMLVISEVLCIISSR